MRKAAQVLEIRNVIVTQWGREERDCGLLAESGHSHFQSVSMGGSARRVTVPLGWRRRGFASDLFSRGLLLQKL